MCPHANSFLFISTVNSRDPPEKYDFTKIGILATILTYLILLQTQLTSESIQPQLITLQNAIKAS